MPSRLAVLASGRGDELATDEIPTDYPLGDVTVHISFTLTSGKPARLDYPITVIP